LFSFDNRQKGGLGLSASRGVGSPEVCYVEEQEQSRKMVGVCPRSRRSGRLTFTRGSGGHSVWAVGPQPGVGVVFCSRLVRSRHEGPQTSRNNCSGLLRACHIREHRRQKFTMMFSKSRWQQPKDLWSSPRKVVATASGLIAIVGAVVAIMRWIAAATSGA
jgi:hypothetical protein